MMSIACSYSAKGATRDKTTMSSQLSWVALNEFSDATPPQGWYMLVFQSLPTDGCN